MEEVKDFAYSIQDPGLWIQFAINIALSALGLFVYIVLKVWKIAPVIGAKRFLSNNAPFFLWHAMATLAIALVAFFSPESMVATLAEFGIAIKADAAFLTIGMAIASMAYGDKKKEMLKEIDNATRAKEELKSYNPPKK